MSTASKLTVTSPSDCEITMTRLFDAPRLLVYDCYTKPELLKQWLRPEGAVCDNDVKLGGSYRWVWQDGHGHEMGMTGSYLEIAKPERIVRTEKIEQDPTKRESVGALLLAEQDGKTLVTTKVLFASRAARDGALASGIDKGILASSDLLDLLLATELKEPSRPAA